MDPETKDRIVFIYADDDRDDHQFLSEAINFSSLQYELKSVYDGSELIQLLSEKSPGWQPKFVLVDLNMPKIDGFQAIHHIKNKLKLDDVPIYVMSTSRSYADMQRTKTLGVAGYFTKPGNIYQLRDILEEIVIKTSKLQNKYQD